LNAGAGRRRLSHRQMIAIFPYLKQHRLTLLDTGVWRPVNWDL
jgi:hypothetical protein